LGGGLPIGAIGGKKEIMEQISPAGKVYQAGTFNGHPLSLAAGLATLDVLEKEKVHDNVNQMGDSLRAWLRDSVNDLGLDYNVSGVGSMFKIFFGPSPANYQEALKCDKQGYFDFFHKMLDSGVFLPPSQFETNFLSAAHTEEDLNKTLEAYEENLRPN
jgi:glutamate-1-semialdehyde 2,1-aminomutase